MGSTEQIIELVPTVDPLTGREVWCPAAEPAGPTAPAPDPAAPDPAAPAAADPVRGGPDGRLTWPAGQVRLPDERFAEQSPAIGVPGDPWLEATPKQQAGQEVVLSPSGVLEVVESGAPAAAVRLPDDRFAAPVPAAGSPFALPWVVTDEALARLDEHLAGQAPEVGAALLGPRGTRLVTAVLPDPVRRGPAEYWHSDPLRELLARALQDEPGLTYLGTAHSHPGGLAAPSGPDHAAFRAVLDANPQVRDFLFPIVVRRHRDDLDPALLGGHLQDLDGGTLAGFTAVADGPSTHVVPVPVRVLPVAAVTAAVCRSTGWQATGGAAVAGPGGDAWLRVTFTTGPDVAAEVLLPSGFPLAAPLLRRPGAPFRSPAWEPAADPAGRLAAALTVEDDTWADTRPGASAAAAADPGRGTAPPGTGGGPPVSDADLRAGLRARLAHHLPAERDWHVAVVGAGSVGSLAAEALTRCGVTRLTLVDPDTVEAANLSRTVYAAADVGRAKVAALADRLAAVAPGVEVTAVVAGIDPVGPLPVDLAGVDAVLLATDDTAAELRLNAVLYPAGVAMVSAKLFARADAGEVLVVVPQARTPCLRCLTGGRAAGGDRQVDYGTGRLVAELALGPDIAGVAQRAVKVLLAVLARRDGGGPLADWIAPLLNAGRTLHLVDNLGGWGIFGQLDIVPLDGPYASLWARTTRADDCPCCGTEPVASAGQGRPRLRYADTTPTALDGLLAQAGEFAPTGGGD